MVDDSETLNSLTSLSKMPFNDKLKKESLPNTNTANIDGEGRSNIDEYQLKKIKVLKLQDQISQLKAELLYLKQNEDLVEQFRKTINELLCSREKSSVCYEIEKERIIHEKSQLIEDLLSAENSYKDVKGKYERSRDLIIRYKTDEDNLKLILKERTDKLKDKEQHFERLKCHAELGSVHKLLYPCIILKR